MSQISYIEKMKNRKLGEFHGRQGICQQCREEKQLVGQTNFCKQCYDKIYTSMK